jgi:GAF domain-containing protein
LLGICQPPGKQLNEEEIDFISALLGLAASSIENARAHTKLNKPIKLWIKNPGHAGTD